MPCATHEDRDIVSGTASAVPFLPPMKPKATVFVAMSGGVDSSVTAALLVKEGYSVVGVYMKNWSEDEAGLTYCTHEQDFADVRAVCQYLNIPYYTFNFEEGYRNKVLDYFFSEYKAGRTPNPDVMCNKEVKFDLFFKKALELGADYIATGHHIRKGEIRKGSAITYSLLKGKDPIKDQTYFVYNLNQEQLSRCLFPIGEYEKSKIRDIAHKMKLPTADKKDSQGICFIGPVDVRDFLKTVITPKKGKIVNSNGDILGEHEGAWFYTIGQRRIEGLNGQPNPLYVIGTDTKKNLVIVGTDAQTFSSQVLLEDLHLISPPLDLRKNLTAKPRYGPEVYPGTLAQQEGKWIFTFTSPTRALTPGQSLVIYDKDTCLGGGVVDKVLDAPKLNFKPHALR